MSLSVKAYAATAADKPIGPFELNRREPGAKDVEIEILFCGVCHSDLHTAGNEWETTVYPLVVGHDEVGRVTRAGAEAKHHKAGDIAGEGCMVGSCRGCD